VVHIDEISGLSKLALPAGVDAIGTGESPVTDEAQATIASLGYRPYKDDARRASKVHLPTITLFPITALASNWDDAQEKFFAENGIIDTIVGSRPK
jgi:ABC-type sulfate transport system substrate-binding protein